MNSSSDFQWTFFCSVDFPAFPAVSSIITDSVNACCRLLLQSFHHPWCQSCRTVLVCRARLVYIYIYSRSRRKRASFPVFGSRARFMDPSTGPTRSPISTNQRREMLLFLARIFGSHAGITKPARHTLTQCGFVGLWFNRPTAKWLYGCLQGNRLGTISSSNLYG